MKKLIYVYTLFGSFILCGMEQPYLREYATVMRIKNRIYTEAENIKASQKGASITLEKMRDQFTYEDQTAQGYFLEVRNDIPMAICWALGRVKFIKGGSVQANGDKLLLQRLKDIFGLELFHVGRRLLTASGGSDAHEITPTTNFKILKIDGELLPDPQFKIAEEYVSIDTAKKIIKELSTT